MPLVRPTTHFPENVNLCRFSEQFLGPVSEKVILELTVSLSFDVPLSLSSISSGYQACDVGSCFLACCVLSLQPFAAAATEAVLGLLDWCLLASFEWYGSFLLHSRTVSCKPPPYKVLLGVVLFCKALTTSGSCHPFNFDLQLLWGCFLPVFFTPLPCPLPPNTLVEPLSCPYNESLKVFSARSGRQEKVLRISSFLLCCLPPKGC